MIKESKACYQTNLASIPERIPERIWYDNHRGYVVKNTLFYGSSQIIREECKPYSHPSVFTNFLDNYFKYKLK